MDTLQVGQALQPTWLNYWQAQLSFQLKDQIYAFYKKYPEK